jgi:hypothetical protein
MAVVKNVWSGRAFHRSKSRVFEIPKILNSTKPYFYLSDAEQEFIVGIYHEVVII